MGMTVVDRIEWSDLFWKDSVSGISCIENLSSIQLQSCAPMKRVHYKKKTCVSLNDIVLLMSCGIGDLVLSPLEIYGWGQKLTLNNLMEHLLDHFVFYGEALEG